MMEIAAPMVQCGPVDAAAIMGMKESKQFKFLPYIRNARTLYRCGRFAAFYFDAMRHDQRKNKMPVVRAAA